MKKISKFFLIALLCCIANNVLSQKNIDSHNNAWLMYFGNHKLTNKLALHTEYQFRRNDYLNHWQQSLARVGLDYHLNKKAVATGGYGWIVSFPYGQQPIGTKATEHRIFQQFILKNNITRFSFNHRYRLEQRFIENASLNTFGIREVDGFRFRQRARYRLMVSVPLNHAKIIANTLFLCVYDEVFLGFGKGIGANILDQNRLYFALGYQIKNNIGIQAGYLNQFGLKSNGIDAERNHTLQLSLTYNLDFRQHE